MELSLAQPLVAAPVALQGPQQLLLGHVLVGRQRAADTQRPRTSETSTTPPNPDGQQSGRGASHELGESDVPGQEAQRAVYRPKLQDQLRVGDLPGIWKSTNASRFSPGGRSWRPKVLPQWGGGVPLRMTSSMETLMSLELMAFLSTERHSC